MSSYLYKLGCFSKGCLCLLLFLSAIIGGTSTLLFNTRPCSTDSLIVFVVTLATFFLLILIKEKIISEDWNQKKIKNFYYALLLFFLILLLCAGLTTIDERPADIGHLHTFARSFLENGVVGNPAYFEQYPYQIFPAFFITVVYWVGDLFGFGYKVSGTITCCLSIAFSAHISALCVNKLTTPKCGLFFLILATLSPIPYLYSSYYYTDIFGILCISLLLYLLCHYRNSLIWVILFAFVLAIGSLFRSTVVFVLVSFVFCIFIYYKNYLSTSHLLLLVFLYILIIVVIKGILNFSFDYIDTSKGFPATHWIMMGLDPIHSARYWSGHVNFTKGLISGNDNVVISHLMYILAEFNSLPIIDYLQLLIEKIKILWSSGYSGADLNLRHIQNYGNFYELSMGRYKHYLIYWSQSYRLLLIFLFIKGTAQFIYLKETNFIINVIFYFIGIYLAFYLIWEVQERYLITVLLPITILCVYFEFKTQYKRINGKLFLLCLFLFCIFSVCLTRDGYGNIVEKKVSTYDWSVRQLTDNSHYILDQSVSQTFTASNHWNRFELFFEPSRTHGNNYCLRVQGEDVKKDLTFRSDQIIKGKLTLKLPVMKSGKYTITLIPSNTNKSFDAIRIFSGSYDRYTLGELVAPNLPIKSDLKFQVYYYAKETLMKPIQYLFVAVSIILVFIFLALFLFKNDKSGSLTHL